LVTHADSDHVGGLIDVLNAVDIPVKQVLYNGYEGDTGTWYTFATAVSNEGLTMTAVQFPGVLTWGQNTAYILNPVSGLINPETNDASVVLLLNHENVKFLFAGDIDSTVEATVVARGTPVAADILKVAHHGSAYSSSSNFLSAAQPDDAVISVGPNSYGHPAAETLARLQAAGARIWRADQNGMILVISNGATYTLQDSVTLIYLPLILRQKPPATTTPTPTPTPTVTLIATSTTPTRTLTPTPTATQSPVITGNVVITNIFYNGTGSQEPDEYVEIRNDDTRAIQLNSWTLRDIANHVYTFPSFIMQPNQVCRVYTNQNHPESCGFNYGSGSAIWNNTGDCAYLRNGQANPIDNYCY